MTRARSLLQSTLVAASLALSPFPIIAYAAPSSPPAMGPDSIARYQAVLGVKQSLTQVEQKLEPTLLFTVRAMEQATLGADSEGLPAFVQSFIDDNVAPDSGVFVVMKATVSADLVQMLQSLGARDLSSFPQYETITATVPVGALRAIAQRDDVRLIGPRELSMTQRYWPDPDDPRARATAKSGSVNWQGVLAHQADKAHAAGITGAGARVCILSNGIASLAARVASGNLPAGVTALGGQAGTGDEGTAMLEIVHDMAPGAALSFATAVTSVAQFASNITTLNAVFGCTIMVDDVIFLNEGAFQDGPIAQAVNAVTAAGVIYLSSAGNYGSVAHASSSTFEGDFVASASPLPAPILALEGPSAILHSFGALPYTTLTKATNAVSLKWSDPLGGSANDYDLFVMNSTGTSILGSIGGGPQTGFQDPVEIAGCSSCTFPIGSRIYIVKFSGATRALRLQAYNGSIANGTTGSTVGHNAAASALTVGAVDVVTAAGGSFVGGVANPVTFYSSDGPRKMFYNPNGTAITPGNILFATNGGVNLAKIDLAASDCGSTTTPGFTQFCGTSAAAPSAGAVAALIKSAKPAATRAQVTAALLNSAIDNEGPGVDGNSGAGIVMAPAGVRAMLSPLVVAKSFVPPRTPPGGSSVLTIAVSNPNTVALSGVQFTNSYPSAAVVNAAAPNVSTTGTGCTATVAASAGSNFMNVGAATIPAGTTCTFRASVTSSTLGTFVDTSGALSTPIALNAAGASAPLTVALPRARGDTDGDSKADLFWRTGAPGTGLSWWKMNGNALVSSNYFDVDPVWQIARVGDLNGDGKTDIVWRRTTDGAAYLWTLDGLTPVGFFDLGVLSPAQWTLAGVADLDGDGRSDIVWRGADGTVYAWLMNGGTIVSQGVVAMLGNEWSIVALADMDGNGTADIVWRRSTDGAVAFWAMNGLVATSGATIAIVDPAVWTIAGVADFNGDFKGDILWRSNTNDTVVWLQDGGTQLQAGSLGNTGPGWSVKALSDFDGDGKADIVWRHTDGTTVFWKMNGVTSSSVGAIANPGSIWQVVGP